MSKLESGAYKINDPEKIETPAMLVYEDMVRHNIDEIIRVCGGPDKLVPHVKTHKSPQILQMQIDAGITAFKCATLSEAEMVAGSDAKEIFIAYPLTNPKKLERLFRLKEIYPKKHISVIAGDNNHLEILSEAAAHFDSTLTVYMDMELGSEHGTGVQPGQPANQLYDNIANSPGLIPGGIHAYDGHVGNADEPGSREQVVQANLEKVYSVKETAEKNGLNVPDIIAGGSWSFLFYTKESGIRVSPGNWIYFDILNSVMRELRFKKASVILGQVIDQQMEWGTVTVDIGQKSVSHDPEMEKRFTILGKEKAKLVGQSEEHGVIKLNDENLQIGDFFLASPGHACMTTVKYPFSLGIDKNGDVSGTYEHTGRDRHHTFL
jgi:D-serine deaminase-like pyridoxal phosphate-dependent protein